MQELTRRRFLQGVMAISAAPMATARIASAAPLDISRIRLCTEPPSPSKGAALDQCLWRQKTVRVGFVGGLPAVQEKVVRHAQEWMAYCPIQFKFGQVSGASIRISFDSGCGSWSCIGLCGCSDQCQPTATMNFGWVTPTSSDVTDREVILHEFGHTLGLIHEHQNPGANIPWNKEKVYEYYRRTQKPPWTRPQVDENIFAKYREDLTSHTAYDDSSIMRYAIPPELVLDGRERPWNKELSQTDKDFIGKLYAHLNY